MVNDVWGFQYDDGSMARVAADYGVPAILMHNQNGTVYTGDIISSMKSFFDRTLSIAFAAGVKEENIILDPGIGFGKPASRIWRYSPAWMNSHRHTRIHGFLASAASGSSARSLTFRRKKEMRGQPP